MIHRPSPRPSRVVVRTALRAAGLLLLLALVGCCTDPVTGRGYFCLVSVSEADEVRIGQAYQPNFVAENGGEYPDSEIRAYLEPIVIAKMAARSHRPELPWEFHILNTSALNAFALPGGKVFVTRGLLARLDSEAQFAHLMGHEIGHVSHRHFVRAQNRGVLLGAVIGAIDFAERSGSASDPDDPPLLAPTAAALGQLTLLHYSRDQEHQSDERGVDYAVLAGYDPREGRRTFEMFLRVKEESGRGESLIAGLLSTHPLDTARIERIDGYIRDEYPEVASGERNLVTSDAGWSRVREKIRGQHAVYEKYDAAAALLGEESADEARLDEAESLLREGERELRDHAPFPALLGLVALRRNDLNGALRHLDRAVSLDEDLFDARLYRGVAHRRKADWDEARSDWEHAHELYAAHPLPCFLLGDLEEARGDAAAARQWYEAALARTPAGTPFRDEIRRRLEALGQAPASA